MVQALGSALAVVSGWLLLAAPAWGALALPQLDIQNFAGDAGVTQSGGVLNIEATAFVVLDEGGVFDIVDRPLQLSAQFAAANGSSYAFTNGQLSLGPALQADVPSLTVTSLGHGLGFYTADLVYTAGVLAEGLTGGRLEGLFSGATTNNFSNPFVADTVIAQLGPVAPGSIPQLVAPLPSAAWLFGLALVGLRPLLHKGRARQSLRGDAVAGAVTC